MKEKTEYMTVKECADVCRYKGPEPIRRLVYRGILPAVRVRHNRLLVPAKAFWEWFHKGDVKIQPIEEIEIPDGAVLVPGTPHRKAHLRIPKKEGQPG